MYFTCCPTFQKSECFTLVGLTVIRIEIIQSDQSQFKVQKLQDLHSGGLNKKGKMPAHSLLYMRQGYMSPTFLSDYSLATVVQNDWNVTGLFDAHVREKIPEHAGL